MRQPRPRGGRTRTLHLDRRDWSCHGLLAGFRILRRTWSDLEAPDAARTAATIRALLRRRR